MAKRGGVLITWYGMVERNYDLLGIEGLSSVGALWAHWLYLFETDETDPLAGKYAYTLGVKTLMYNSQAVLDLQAT